jgi:hypothetical protein
MKTKYSTFHYNSNNKEERLKNNCIIYITYISLMLIFMLILKLIINY